jgi:hypothetical protein
MVRSLISVAQLGTLLPAIALSLGGCSDAEPVLSALEGKVTYRGKPTPQAQLVFHPQFEGPGWMPVATVNDDGTFQASTKAPGDGVLPGRYKVTVVWHPQATDEAEGPNFLPPKYSLPTSSPLEIEVDPEGTEPTNFELND